MRGLLIAGVFTAALAFAAGCGKKPANSEQSGTTTGPKPPPEVTLVEGGAAEIDKAVKEAKNAVVLVEFWTMATEPSPDLALAADTNSGYNQPAKQVAKDRVAWHGVRKAEYLGAKYEGHFLRVILVNVDGPEKKDEVLKFLKDHDAKHVTSFAWKGDPASAAAYGFTGKVPHQVVFGRKGNRVWATGEPLPSTFDSLLFAELDK